MNQESEEYEAKDEQKCCPQDSIYYDDQQNNMMRCMYAAQEEHDRKHKNNLENNLALLKQILNRLTPSQERAITEFGLTREIVAGKSPKEIDAYLDTIKQALEPIHKMAMIRVIVNFGEGWGHQRAAITLMQKLREMGFNGIFDIQCDDKVGEIMYNGTDRGYCNTIPIVSTTVKKMLPELQSLTSEQNSIIVPGLGAVQISSFSQANDKNLKLQPADLAVCAACDNADDIAGLTDIASIKKINNQAPFGAPLYLVLQPTGWKKASCCIIDKFFRQKVFINNYRLFAAATNKFTTNTMQTLQKTTVEQKVLEIAANPNINSQLIYGLNPSYAYDRLHGAGLVQTGFLNAINELQLIIQAHQKLLATTKKSIILLMPQSIILKYTHVVYGIFNKNVFFIDLTKDTYNEEQYKQDAIIVAYTGPLQQTVFDYLMLQGTTLPPVIEGCNSVETCESAGKSFIHGSNASTPLQQFDVVSLNMQELHTMASRCLEQGDAKYLPQLVRYMQEHLDTTSELHQYHQQRQEQFMTIPDACEFFFNLLGIKYNAQQPETKTEHTILHPQVSKIKTTMFYSQVALEDTKQDSFIKNIDI